MTWRGALDRLLAGRSRSPVRDTRAAELAERILTIDDRMTGTCPPGWIALVRDAADILAAHTRDSAT
ncbi:MAG: hypothetical protein KAY22_05595 [Rhizorhabdus sp.]|uniref:hypothetical protein n=1 Tax=Rhizorhabdus sp. TaxID=1968843 RepID=UPI001B5FF1F8|nr:hypothetical protein [Rhizorhabdus sp.]MBP8231759.1 hypothetical protein [Rhizorhabdus sp.]